jgi:hypothetical protein
MTNNEPISPAALRASQDRRLAALRATPAPIMPAVIRRPPPKARRNSVPHRAIR